MAFVIDLDMLLEYCNADDVKVNIEFTKINYLLCFEFSVNGVAHRVKTSYSRKILNSMTNPNAYLFDELLTIKRIVENYKEGN